MRLRRAQQKEMLGKITEYIAKVIEMKTSEDWTAKEIAQELGIPAPRITELRNYQDYKKSITDKQLAGFIEKGFVTVDEIIENCKLSEEEADALKDSHGIFEDQKLIATIRRLKEKGINPHKVLLNYERNMK